MKTQNKMNKFLPCSALLLSLCITKSVQADTYLASGHSFMHSTYLIEIVQDTSLSLKTRELRYGGFETSRGNRVEFNNWYTSKWYDTRISWMTQINQNFGVLWGFSTGEKAAKYSIDPGLKLGFLYQIQPQKHSFFSIAASTVAGGQLTEKVCTADYGEIGGIQDVNCRLAATVLEPSETLKYLFKERPESSITIQYKYFFY